LYRFVFISSIFICLILMVLHHVFICMTGDSRNSNFVIGISNLFLIPIPLIVICIFEMIKNYWKK
jgi:hypothetical protein